MILKITLMCAAVLYNCQLLLSHLANVFQRRKRLIVVLRLVQNVIFRSLNDVELEKIAFSLSFYQLKFKVLKKKTHPAVFAFLITFSCSRTFLFRFASFSISLRTFASGMNDIKKQNFPKMAKNGRTNETHAQSIKTSKREKIIGK